MTEHQDAPVVEMLWESHDPRDALDRRFGFADGASVGRWIGTVLDRYWGVHVHACERVVISARNALAWVRTSNGRMLAKWSVARDHYPNLLETSRLVHWLGGQGLPVSAPVPALDGSVQREVDGVSMGLQHEIEGELLDTGRPQQVRATGAVLARLQDALAAYPAVDRLAALAEPPRSLTSRITDWLDSETEHLPAGAVDALRRLVTKTPAEEPPVQLVHFDIRSANIICAGSEVAAVIDFESTTIDHWVLELARSAVMLGTQFRNWGPISADVRAEFLTGYRSVRDLTPIEAAWWDVLLLWQGLANVPPGDDPAGWGPSAMSQLAELTH